MAFEKTRQHILPDIISDLDWAVNDVEVHDAFEELRSACENIRSWGQQWKDIAINMIETTGQYRPKLSNEAHRKLEQKEQEERKRLQRTPPPPRTIKNL